MLFHSHICSFNRAIIAAFGSTRDTFTSNVGTTQLCEEEIESEGPNLEKTSTYN